LSKVSGSTVCPLRGFPALLAKRRVRPNSRFALMREPLKQGSLLPRFSAMLGCTDSPKKPDKPTLQVSWQIPAGGKTTVRHSGAGRNPCAK